MTARFNPPPGWTLVGLGAVPGADWHPGGSVPPSPPNWPFYLDDRGYATLAPTGAWQPPETPAAPPGTAAAGRHRRQRRRPRWAALLIGLPVTAVSLTVLALAVSAALGL